MNFLKNSRNSYDYIPLLAFFLGVLFMLGFSLSFTVPILASFGTFIMCWVIYHVMEYTYVGLFHPQELSIYSFMFVPNDRYLVAMAISMTEHFLELFLLPKLKSSSVLFFLGLFMVVVGQIFRSGAMFTAGKNFHHLIRERRDNQHQLVTHGIYRLCRHPSYFGWFVWALGTQVLLVNPISLCAWVYVLWKFFMSRIAHEEVTLKYFFGQSYMDYSTKVTKFIPFCY